MLKCPCGLPASYNNCCGQFHLSLEAPTPEKLMRSRYCAFTLGNMDYIENTMQGVALSGFNKISTQKWATSVQWMGLKIIQHNTISDEKGFVEFIASFIHHNKLQSIHENSEFHQVLGRWYYVNGITPQNEHSPKTIKLWQNALCPCQSLKKFKNCHGK